MTHTAPSLRRVALLVVAVALLVPAFPAVVVAARPGVAASSDIQPGEVDRTSLHLSATYDASATLTWATGTIAVRSEATIRNTSGGPIDRVELNTIAGALGSMDLKAVTVDGQPADATFVDQTIIVPLGGVLPEGQTVRVLVRYTATLRAHAGRRSYLFSRDHGIASVHRWIPWVSRRFPFWGAVGDAWVTPVSPSVRVSITSDRALIYASTGRQTGTKGSTATFEATKVRDFNFTAAPDFKVLRGWSRDGDTRIVIYSRTLPRDVMLDYTRRAIAAFEAKLGEYPWGRFTVSESSGGLAMESPGHVWIPWGRSRSGIPFPLVHEIGHQWFYGVVGNDQPAQPFADEGVTEFLTRWFFGSFRGSSCALDRLDLGIRAYDGCFYEVIYVQGASFLEKMRRDIGSLRFWETLRAYIQGNRWEISSNRKLLEALRIAADAAEVDVIPRYRSRFPSIY
jgi:hypothetical protein